MTRTVATAAVLIALLAPSLTRAEDPEMKPEPAVAVDESSAAHAETVVCLSRAEQRQAIANGQAVTLGAAIHSARLSVRSRGGRAAREVVKARLCREPEGLRYVLTVLARDGKVTHTSVDAT